MCIFAGVSSIPIERSPSADDGIADGNFNDSASDMTNEISLSANAESRNLPDTDLDEGKTTAETSIENASTTPAPKVEVRLISIPMPIYPGFQQLCQHRAFSNCGCMSNNRYNPVQMHTCTGCRSPASSCPFARTYHYVYPSMPSTYMARSYQYPVYTRSG